MRNKVGVLQQELGNSEAVQKDFVRLSQSLQVRQQYIEYNFLLVQAIETILNLTFHLFSIAFQMELEKIRAADTQIRWQDDDDADDCPSCKLLFTVTRRKVTIDSLTTKYFTIHL